jgi:hypothetical protein
VEQLAETKMRERRVGEGQQIVESASGGLGRDPPGLLAQP